MIPCFENLPQALRELAKRENRTTFKTFEEDKNPKKLIAEAKDIFLYLFKLTDLKIGNKYS